MCHRSRTDGFPAFSRTPRVPPSAGRRARAGCMITGMSADWARPVVHWEIEAVDAEKQKAFYGALFHWDVGEGPIMQIAPGLGGPEPGPAGHIRQGGRSGVALYVQVRDIHAS